jgi:hypothetical protein
MAVGNPVTSITGQGTYDAVPSTRTITINSTTFDLSANRTWTISGGGGGVTSVDMSVPTGFAISGNPITTSGTLALSFSSGYSLPTTIKQTNWDDAYTFVTNFPSQTGNSGKYLTTNGSTLSWATISASAAGNTGEIQYNNSGSFAGAAYAKITNGYLNLKDSGNIAGANSGEVAIFADSHAGRILPAAHGNLGSHYDIQPALFGSSTFVWLAGTGTTTAINWGTAFTARNSGTGAAQATPARTSTSALTSMSRATYSTGSTATGASGIQSSETIAWLGNAANLGGFFFHARFALEAISGTYRAIVGLSANNAALAGQPSVLNNTIAMSVDSTDATWQIITRNATAVTKTDTGLTPDTSTIYDLYLFAETNATSIRAQVRNAVTGSILYTSAAISTNLPVSTTFMYMQCHISSATGTTPKLISLNRMYLESDL